METKYDYDFFLFSQLAMANGAVNNNEPYDFLFGDIIELYEDFLTSGSNDGYKGLYECIEHYFINLNAK